MNNNAENAPLQVLVKKMEAWETRCLMGQGRLNEFKTLYGLHQCIKIWQSKLTSLYK
jgi:hypothetical protein